MFRRINSGEFIFVWQETTSNEKTRNKNKIMNMEIATNLKAVKLG